MAKRISVQRRNRGRIADHAGRSAEDIVCREYLDRGAQVLGRRWSAMCGEIDLIFDHQGTTVFVEVKKSDDFGAAAARVGHVQIARLSQAAEAFLGTHTGSIASECRFDVALVDRVGRVEVLENAFA